MGAGGAHRTASTCGVGVKVALQTERRIAFGEQFLVH